MHILADLTRQEELLLLRTVLTLQILDLHGPAAIQVSLNQLKSA